MTFFCKGMISETNMQG